jgi:glycosyltransferase involved in cell wall biosynthesis
VPADIVCLSHLRWDFVYQRPNHLMARAARGRRVYFVEEPTRHPGNTADFELNVRDGVVVVRLMVPDSTRPESEIKVLRDLFALFLASEGIRLPWLWFYTPMALPWTADVRAAAVIYDCMDELSGFKNAPPQIRDFEQRLLQRADVVFAGGRTLYEAKRGQHANAFLFPSSVDGEHFGRAREGLRDPADQADIAHPRIGYFGVIDERVDLDLIRDVAATRPEWHIVMVGPLAKISEEDLPRAANIHWLGMKSYAELPAYLSGWDVAIMPFALNEATRHISPTKTPEYLSGGRPVVSTPIHDVVHPYGDENLVYIAADADSFAEAIERGLAIDREDLMARADVLLGKQSWDATWTQMEQRVLQSLRNSRAQRIPVAPRPGVGVRATYGLGVAGVTTARPR